MLEKMQILLGVCITLCLEIVETVFEVFNLFRDTYLLFTC